MSFGSRAEVAFDKATALRAWKENVPVDLTNRSGAPVEAGVYGDINSVDFSRQAVVVWSSGKGA